MGFAFQINISNIRVKFFFQDIYMKINDCFEAILSFKNFHTLISHGQLNVSSILTETKPTKTYQELGTFLI